MYLWGDERRGSRVKTVPWLGSHHAACAGVWHVYWWRDATSGSCFQPVVVCIWSPCLLAYCTWRGLHCSVWHLFFGSWSAWIVPLQALLLFIWMMCLWAPPHQICTHGFAFSLLLLGRQLWWIAEFRRTARYRAHWRSAWHFLQDAEEVVRAGVLLRVLCTR